MSYEQEPEAMYDDGPSMNFDEPPAQRREDRMVRVKGIKKTNIEALFSNYLAKVEGAEGNLFTGLTKFAQSKVYGRMRESADADVNYKDVAQDAVISVWEQLQAGKFTGSPSGFYAWVDRIAFASGSHAAGTVKAEFMRKVPLQVESDDDPGFMKDNPEVYQQRERKRMRPIPEFIQGLDRRICKLIRAGLSYKQIADEHGVTESAIKQRVAKVKKLVEAAKVTKV